MNIIEIHFNDGHYTEFSVSEARMNKFKEWILNESPCPFHIMDEDADYYLFKSSIKYAKIFKAEE